jgi:hypothetical protein
VTRVFSDKDHTFDGLLEYPINGFLQDTDFVLEGIASLDERIDLFHGLHKTYELRVSVQLTFDDLESSVRRNDRKMVMEGKRT